MKILHTADWHLGKSLKNYNLLEDQKFILTQILSIIEEQKPDVILIAGDIYDRSIPSAEAVSLFDDTIEKIILDLKIPVIAIAGNHDSAERTNCFNNLLKRQGFHIFGDFTLPVQSVVLEDNFGKVYFYPVPYIEPHYLEYLIQHTYQQEIKIETHQAAMDWIVNHIKEIHPKNERIVLIGHLFVMGGQESESERQLSVGGASMVNPRIFDYFHYTALGHLHAYQTFAEKKVVYSSSILKYSFSEANQAKGLVLFELDDIEIKNSQFIPLIPKRDLLIVKGKIENRAFQLSSETKKIPERDDFLEIHIENEEVVQNAMQIVQEKYPNTMTLKWPNRFQGSLENRTNNLETLQQMTHLELFEEFFKACEGKELNEEQKSIIQSTIKETQKNI